MPHHAVTRFGFSLVIWASLMLMLQPHSVWSVEPTTAEGMEYFEKRIRPLLETHCLECHSPQNGEPQGGLRLDTAEGWSQGGELGPAIVPGDPQASLLMEAVLQTGDRVRMPPDGRLSEQEIEHLRHWITLGAPDPRQSTSAEPSPASPILTSKPWSFAPLRDVHPEPPHSRSDDPTFMEGAGPLDWLLASHWRKLDLHPAPQADRRTLLRRISYDLTGLPPTPEEMDQFIHDPAPDAYERLVDRLLASPRYGERWGRFWLDVARYADSNGLDENIALGNAWRYRDYVIASFNRDKPFNAFVLEQLAGDLLSDDESTATRHERWIATGFLSLGPKVLAEVDETKMEMDIVDEQVETVGRAFLALTLGCARCHDHKFDPISTADYYGLAGIFKSTRTMEHFTKIAKWNEVSLATDSERAAQEQLQKRIQEQSAALKSLREKKDGSELTPQHAQQISQLESQLAQAQAQIRELPSAMSVTDYPQPTNLAIHIRGNHLTKGQEVPRRLPTSLATETLPEPQLPSTQSGRKELAQWLVDPHHPITARVIVNRIWRWHFGVGLSPSTDNFGTLGEPPQQPEILDWLARQLIEHDWSIKQIQRTIVLSHAYRLADQPNPHNSAIDPDNRYLWRHSIRRLEVEAIRDAMLYSSGLLDERMGGSLLHVKNREFLFDHTSKDETRYDVTRRSIYLPVIRNHLYDMFQLFDYTDASVINSNRAATTVAPQALFLMNSDLPYRAAQRLAQSLCESCLTVPGRLQRGYETVFGRSPTADELQRETGYLQTCLASAAQDPSTSPQSISPEVQAWTSLCHHWFMRNEFLYVR